MYRLGDHDYYIYNRENARFMLTLGDSHSISARRFVNSINQSNVDSLFEAIYSTIWIPNRYNVRTQAYDTYLFGQDSTQDFINTVATNTTFFGTVPLNLICLANVAFYPYSCAEFRWNIELDFGSSSEFHVNVDPNDVSQNPPLQQ